MKKTIKLSEYICNYLLYILAFIILAPLFYLMQLISDLTQIIFIQTVKKYCHYKDILAFGGGVDLNIINTNTITTNSEKSKNYTCCNCVSRYNCQYAFNDVCIDGDCLQIR